MAVTKYISRRGLTDGVFGGRRQWLVLGAVVWLARLLKRIVSRSVEVVSIEKLEPGQSVTVSALDSSADRSKRSRRRPPS